jgi:hypothetical protein
MLQNPVRPRNGALSLVNRDTVSAIAFRNSIEQIRRRYQRVAPIYPVFELVFLLPRGIRHRAVHRLGLASRDSVLEVGCGTGEIFDIWLTQSAKTVGCTHSIAANKCSAKQESSVNEVAGRTSRC